MDVTGNENGMENYSPVWRFEKSGAGRFSVLQMVH